jgi:hypothetical protein
VAGSRRRSSRPTRPRTRWTVEQLLPPRRVPAEPKPGLVSSSPPVGAGGGQFLSGIKRAGPGAGPIYLARTGTRGSGWGHTGRAALTVDGPRVRSFLWPPLRLTRVRSERGSVRRAAPGRPARHHEEATRQGDTPRGDETIRVQMQTLSLTSASLPLIPPPINILSGRFPQALRRE